MIADLLQLPLPDRSVYNELAPDGVTPRPHWAQFIESLQSIGSDELARRWERAERRIRENGVTYNVYTDPQGVSRPLAIDPIPLLIAPEEWRFIEAGIIQRANLLNLILEDIYGARKLVTNGDLPAALLFANPAFLRPLVGIPAPRGSYLHLLAVDLARSPDGRWWVLRGPYPSAFGNGLCARKSHHCRGCIAGRFPNRERQAPGLFFQDPTRGAAGAGPFRSSASGAADAGTIQ